MTQVRAVTSEILPPSIAQRPTNGLVGRFAFPHCQRRTWRLLMPISRRTGAAVFVEAVAGNLERSAQAWLGHDVAAVRPHLAGRAEVPNFKAELYGPRQSEIAAGSGDR